MSQVKIRTRLYVCKKISKQAIAHHVKWGTCPEQSHSSTQVPTGFGYIDRLQRSGWLFEIDVRVKTERTNFLKGARENRAGDFFESGLAPVP